MVEHLFSGSALSEVDHAGRLGLPRFVRNTLGRRRAGRALLVGGHESDPCLVACDRGFASVMHSDLERRRVAEGGLAARLHDARVRTAFGLLEEAEIDSGSVLLPPLTRQRVRINRFVLCVGVGGTFEIWDLERAAETWDSSLRELAAFHLARLQAAKEQYMRLDCLWGTHRALPPVACNQGFQFSTCSRCGRDMVRSGRSWRRVPRGFRVVWRGGRGDGGSAGPIATDSDARPRRPVRGLAGLVDLILPALRLLLSLLFDHMRAIGAKVGTLPKRSAPVLRLPPS